MAAARADEALRPTPLLKRLFALILGPIIFEIILQTQAFWN
jgi:ABC-type arginine/histidine transport system permease subunit